MIARIKKNDTVIVKAGKDKDKRGTVIEIVPKKAKVMVKDVAVVKRHAKARKQGDVAGIKKKESYIAISKVMPFCTACNKPCRINSKILQDGKKVRICNRCKEIF